MKLSRILSILATVAIPLTAIGASVAPSSASAAVGMGEISGSMWFDTNTDGIKQAAEPMVTGGSLSVGGYTFGANGIDNGWTGDDVAFAPKAVAVSVSGSYLVTGLLPGKYKVNLGTVYNLRGLTASTHPFLNGMKTVGQAVGLTGQNFGMSSLLPAYGQVNGTTTGANNVPMTLKWSGLDGAIGTADDATFTATSMATGTFGFKNLPLGLFTLTAATPVGVKAAAPVTDYVGFTATTANFTFTK
jgi:large repetitive protein